MECNECNKRPASLYFTQIINGKKTEVHVCEQCAQKKGYTIYGEDGQSLHDLLKGLFDFSSSQMEVNNEKIFKQTEDLYCSKCHLTFRDFQRIGKFGCAQCYDSFVVKLDSIFRRVHSGNTKHFGKIPKRKGGVLHKRKQLEEYRVQLSELVQQENFEEAAIVRDKIRELEHAEIKEDGEHL